MTKLSIQVIAICIAVEVADGMALVRSESFGDYPFELFCDIFLWQWLQYINGRKLQWSTWATARISLHILSVQSLVGMTDNIKPFHKYNFQIFGQ